MDAKLKLRLKSIKFNPKIPRNKKNIKGYQAFLLPKKPKQKCKSPRLATDKASPLTLHSVSSIPGKCSPVREAPEVFEHNLSRFTLTHEDVYPWAPAATSEGSSSTRLFNKCIEYINDKIKNILVDKYGMEKCELIMQEQLNRIEALNGNYFVPVNGTIKENINADHEILKEVQPSLLALHKMQSVKIAIKEWKVREKVNTLLIDCNDYDEIKKRSWILDEFTEGLCNHFFQLISSVSSVKDVAVTLNRYEHHIRSFNRKGKQLLLNKNPRYGHSGRFVYQYIEDNLKALFSVHPCNFRISKYYSRCNTFKLVLGEKTPEQKPPGKKPPPKKKKPNLTKT